MLMLVGESSELWILYNYVGTILLGQSGNQDRSVIHMVVC